MKKTTLITIILLAFFTKGYGGCRWEIARIYFRDHNNNETTEIMTGSPMQVCIETRRIYCSVVDCNCKEEADNRIDIQIGSMEGRVFADGSSVKNLVIYFDEYGRGCQEITIIHKREELREKEIEPQYEKTRPTFWQRITRIFR